MEKPKPILVFDLLFAASMMLGIGSAVIHWNDAMAYLRADPTTAVSGPFIMGVSLVVGYCVNLLLWFFISRRRSNVARWIMTVLTALALVSTLADPADYEADLVVDLTFAASWLLCVAEIVCLFLPGSARWFDRRRDVDAIRDTFR